MKSLVMIFIFICTFFGVYCLLAAFGMLIVNVSFMEITTNLNWFFCYCLFIGWWVSLFPTIEYYNKNIDYFEDGLF